MALHKKLFVVSVFLIFTPLVLLFADATLLNCLNQTKSLPRLLGFLDAWIPSTLRAIPVGFGTLFVALVLEKKIQGKNFKRIVTESILIFILGLLCGSLLLASLNSARSKGPNSGAKSLVSGMRVEAELYFTSNGQTYAGFCTSSRFLDSQAGLPKYMPKQGLLCSVPTYDFVCIDREEYYAVSIKLPNQYTDKEMYFCVDSGGVAKETESPLRGTSCE